MCILAVGIEQAFADDRRHTGAKELQGTVRQWSGWNERQYLATRKLYQSTQEQQEVDQDLFVLASTPRGADTLGAVTDLLRRGANPNTCCNIFGNTPLHETAHFDNLVVAEQLLAAGADVDVVNDSGDTPLHVAGCNAAFRVAKALIKAGAQVNALNLNGDTPLHQATAAGAAKLVKLLVENGADATIRNDDGKTALDVVCLKECRAGAEGKIVKLLTKTTANAVPERRTSKTPPEKTNAELDEELIKLAGLANSNETQGKAVELIRMGASPDACCTEVGGTALHATAEHDNDLIAALLIKHGADVSARDRLDDTPLHIVSVFNSVKVAKLLIDAGADLNANDGIGETPLHHAAEFGKPDIVKLMLDAGADPTLLSDEGDTPEDLICEVPCPPKVKELLQLLFREAGGISTTKQEDLDRELIKVAGEPRTNTTAAVVADLLRQGASPDACCSGFGATALHESTINDNTVAADILISAGADVNVMNRLGDTPLHEAADNSAVAVAQLLIDGEADVDASDNLGETPLHRASEVGSIAVAEMLLLAGADPSKENNKGQTAADLVCLLPCTVSAERRFQDLFAAVPSGVSSPSAKEQDKESEAAPQLQKKINEFDRGVLLLADSPANASTRSSILKILSKGANPDACCNAFGGSALHVCSNFDNDVIASILIAAGADVNFVDSIGDAPLHDAAIVDAPRVADLLIAGGADVNLLDALGESPMHHATEWGSVDVTKALLDAGADSSIVSVNGDTAADLICKKGCPAGARKELEALLLKKGSSTSTRPASSARGSQTSKG